MPTPTLPSHLIGINTKTYFDLPTTTEYITALTHLPPSLTTVLFILPSTTFLPLAASLLQSHPHILLGAQNTHASDSGPHTGAVSPLHLAQLGCQIVCLGHAELRQGPGGDTDADVAAKTAAVVRHAMIPLVCIGEKGRSAVASEGVGIALRECEPQVTSVLDAIPADAPVVFAYEPVWAIGAAEPASADHIVAVARGVRELVRRIRGGVEGVRVLYGGSAGPGTWEGVREGVDGLFLGRFAHEVEALERVVREVQRG